jgi:hypothetical protein
MPKEQFKQEVERELTGKETEPWEIIYFKLYQSQAPVIERAIETAGVECCRGSSGIRKQSATRVHAPHYSFQPLSPPYST